MIVGQGINIRFRKSGQRRQTLLNGEHNVIDQPLVGREEIIFPTVHIKLCLTKHYVCALNVGHCTFVQNYLDMAMIKIKAGVFDGLQMRILMRDPDFINSI